jgi:hypothetical protein
MRARDGHEERRPRSFITSVRFLRRARAHHQTTPSSAMPTSALRWSSAQLPLLRSPTHTPVNAVDAGAVHIQHRVNSSKPLDRNAFPGVELDILIDTEEDRRRSRTPGRQRAAAELSERLSRRRRTAGVIRRRRPTRFAVLIAADDV